MSTDLDQQELELLNKWIDFSLNIKDDKPHELLIEAINFKQEWFFKTLEDEKG